MKVRVLRHKGHAALVEYELEGRLQRVSIPVETVVGDEVSNTVLDQGIPYGIPWDEILKDHTVTASVLAEALKRAGLWTYSDVSANPGALQTAILQASREVVEAVARTAKTFRNIQGG